MKKYIFLLSKDIRSNAIKRLGIILCISLFLAAFISVVWYIDSFHDQINSTVGDIYEAKNKTIISDVILIPVAVSFVITSVFGIVSAMAYSFGAIENNLRLLRCIGFSKRQSGIFLAILGLLIWFCSVTLSCLFAFGTIRIIGYMTNLHCVFSAAPIIAAALISFVLIIISNRVFLGSFFRRSPLRESIYMPKRKRRSAFTLKKSWHKAFGRKHRLQNASIVLLVFLCTAIAAVGSFLPLFNARGRSWNDPDLSGDTDYSLFLAGGNTTDEEYYIQFPAGQGIDRHKADDIIKRYGLCVSNSEGGNLFRPFFLTGLQGDNDLFKYHIERERNDDLYKFSFISPLTDRMKAIAGGDDQKDIIDTLPVCWMSEDTLADKYHLHIDREQFIQGEIIAAPDDHCKPGDRFTVLIPVFDKSLTPENINEKLEFICKEVTVSAVYHSSDENEPLIFSQEYLFSVNDTLNYEHLDLLVSASLSEEQKDQLDRELQTLANESPSLKYLNYDKIRTEFYQEVNSQTTQLSFAIGIFIIIILIAVYLSVNVQMRSDCESCRLLHAIGADKKTVSGLIKSEFDRLLQIGMIPGVISGLTVDLFFSMIGGIRTWDIFLRYVLPITAAEICVLFVIVSISVRNILKKFDTV